jgi:DNA mismatch repair protein MutL
MGNIVLLDEHTINKIAAGEVVDRPASIVKELVENSIDAKATAITIEIKNGGIGYIKIVDNGVGFEADDVEMAFERHATSKIRKEEDLARITSMGFRGEALASIAAISKVTLTTKNKNEEIGTKAFVNAGKIESIEPSASIQGTKIEIRDVFYNVPARFKFLKKDYTEAGYIEDVVIRISLANPDISFKYINNGKTVIQTTGKSDLKSTIFDIFGKEIYQNVISIETEYEGIKVEGVIGLPIVSRSTRMHQFTFVNSRFVKDKTINSAIDKACLEKFTINKFAFIVLNIIMNPGNIDVNVHPAKLEVKFENESQVFKAIYVAIKYALEKKETEDSPFTTIRREENNIEIVKNYDSISFPKITPTNKNFSMINEIYKESFGFKTNDLNENTDKKFEFKLEEPTQDIFYSQINNEEERYTVENLDKEISNNTQNEVYLEKEIEIIKYEDQEILPKEDIIYKYIGQVFDTYIIIQIKEKMYIIDQHAAHERLLYEQIKKEYYSKDKQSQLLLIPILVELTSKEKNIVEENIEMFEKSGFIIEEFGDNAIKISGVPNIGYDIEYKSMFRDIIDELLGASKTELQEKEFRFIATLACKAAVKGNMKLDEQEQKALIADMVKLENPFTCPHGRPTAYEISKYEIERKFSRK